MQEDGAPAIDLIDGDRLCELLRRFELGVSTRKVEEVTVAVTFFEELLCAVRVRSPCSSLTRCDTAAP